MGTLCLKNYGRSVCVTNKLDAMFLHEAVMIVVVRQARSKARGPMMPSDTPITIAYKLVVHNACPECLAGYLVHTHSEPPHSYEEFLKQIHTVRRAVAANPPLPLGELPGSVGEVGTELCDLVEDAWYEGCHRQCFAEEYGRQKEAQEQSQLAKIARPIRGQA